MKRRWILLLLMTTVLLVMATALFACNNKASKVVFVVDGDVYAISTSKDLKVPADPTKEGYSFAGWAFDQAGESLFDGGKLDAKETVYLYAQWRASGTFDDVDLGAFVQEGDEYRLSVDNAVATMDLTAQIHLPIGYGLRVTPKEGSSALGTVLTLHLGDNRYTIMVQGNEERSFEVCVHRNYVYTLRFDANGGTAVEPIGVQEGRTIAQPASTRTGYRLVGWGYDFAQPITQDLNLVAQWEAYRYTLSYLPNGGNEVAAQEVVYGQEFTFGDCARLGYKLDGWLWQNNKVEQGIWRWAHDLEVSAQWSLVQYTITYNMMGGKAQLPAQYTIESGFTLPRPTRDGYEFVGWSENGSEEVVQNVAVPAGQTGDREYTAHWAYNGRVLVYELNGGVNSEDNPAVVISTMGTVTLSPATRTGYLFGGWYTTADFADGTSITEVESGITGELKLYAQWTPITYTVRFDKNDDRAQGTMQDKTYTYDEADTLPLCDYVMAGYRMVWTDEAGNRYEDASQVLNLAEVQDSIVVLYADWTAVVYRLTVQNDSAQSADLVCEISYDDAMPVLAKPSKMGYAFWGYYFGEVQVYNADMVCKYAKWNYLKDITLAAKWQAETYTVWLDANGGNGGVAQVTATYDSLLPTIDVAPSREGFVFAGYYLYSDAIGTRYYDAHLVPDVIWDKAQDATLYAGWSSGSSTISFDMCGGDNYLDDVVAIFDQPMPALANGTLMQGYRFLGFFDSEQGGVCYYTATYASARNWDKVHSTTLYAQWTPIQYTVRYTCAEAHTGAMDDQVFTYDQEQALAANAFARDGYSFVGWQNGDSIGFLEDGQPVLNLTEGDNAIVVLMAIWEKMEYTVTLDDYIQTDYTAYSVSFALNGGDGSVPATQVVDGTNKLTYPLPTRYGYAFRGWFVAGLADTLFDFSKPVMQNVALLAEWQAQDRANCIEHTYLYTPSVGFTSPRSVSMASTSSTQAKAFYFTAFDTGRVHLHLKNSSTSDGNAIKVVVYNQTKGTQQYSTTVRSTDYSDTEIAVVKGDVYCLVCYRTSTTYTPTLTFYFSGDLAPKAGGTSGSYTQHNYTQRIVYDTAYSLPIAPAKEGYTFAGWGNEEGVAYTDSEGNSVANWFDTQPITLYAIWQPKPYTITFVSNGGSAIDPLTAAYGAAIVAPVPTLEGYSFAGWYTTSGLATPFVFDTMPLGNRTLYAKWIPYDVSFETREITYLSCEWDLSAAATYGVVGKDTDGATLPVVVEILDGTGEAGTKIAVRFTVNGKYGKSGQMEYVDLPVYGEPQLYVGLSSKRYIRLKDTLSSSLYRASATDSFGKTLAVSVTATPAQYNKGDIITITISTADVAGNSASQVIENVKVYGLPVITYDRTITAIKSSAALSAATFGALAADSFGESCSVRVYRIAGDFEAGKTITVEMVAQDRASNEQKVQLRVAVYGKPSIGGASKTDFEMGETIDLASMGVVVTDSFGQALEAQLTLLEGVYEAGATLTYRITATDKVGNIATEDVVVHII